MKNLLVLLLMFFIAGCSGKEVTQQIEVKKINVPDVEDYIDLSVVNATATSQKQIEDFFIHLPDSIYFSGTGIYIDSTGRVVETAVTFRPASASLSGHASTSLGNHVVGTAGIKVTQSPILLPDTITSLKEKEPAVNAWINRATYIIITALILFFIYLVIFRKRG